SGTSIPGGGRVFITCKSPLSVPEGLKCETGFGGFWGPELKFSGYDHLIISGRSPQPVYITIDNDEVEIKDAGELWGKDSFETAQLIKDAFDIDARVCSIGQAGENLVRFASILGGEQYSASGRGGSGAVMGSKNLKGIAVRGTGEVKVADPKRLLEITEKWHELIKEIPNYPSIKKQGEFREHFTTALDFSTVGNYETRDISLFKNMKPDDFVESYQAKMAGCMACPRPCFNYMRVPGSPPGGLFCSSYVLLSATIWNNDIHTVWKAGTLCNTYCMDAIEVGGSIAFIMELYRRGIITAKDTDGIPFERGSEKAIIDAIHKIANRKSYGDIFADGIPRAAERIGGNAEKYAVHTKGVFPHGYSFQQLKGHALLQAVGNKGGDPFPAQPPLRFEVAWDLPQVNSIARKVGREKYGSENAIDPIEYSDVKVDVVIDSEHAKRGTDLLGTCTRHVPGAVPKSMALEAFNAATGMGLTEEDLANVEEKLVHLERAFDVREGIRRANDEIPKKWLTQKIDTGSHKGAIIDKKKHEKMKDVYYKKRGWYVKTGIPRRATLERVGLNGVADDLNKLEI
ncbi:aldehyde ferredoxin oxidoreductase family protein, partial [Thermodesulfobacteriota bacterium]